jgi:predicted house-cleaning NTP pyrophosphatase (Maf/HAM1 superfamily)
MDKAGAYDIDQHGDAIIEAFTGSRTGIMGLPEETVAAWLREQEIAP